MSPAPFAVLAAEGAERPVLLPAYYDIIWSAVVFVVLFVLFWRYVLPSYLRVLDERGAKIEGGLERAEKAQAEAQAALEEYREQLADAREEAGRIREQARGEGAAIIAEMRQQAQAEADRITEQSHRQIEAERQQAVTQLRGEVGRLAVELAGRVVGESLSDEERQRRVVDRFLADLESDAVSSGQPAGARSGSTVAGGTA
jgi:F-type H+-transporting ATPase subunit b